MRSITLDDGERLQVAVRGHGPPVVLLHGWATALGIWSRLIDDLARSHTVYAWTARGHGEPHPGSGGGREPPVVARMARDLAAVIGHFGLIRPTLVGHSMGALVLWQLIADHGPGAVGRLCLIDQSPRLVTDADWRLGIYGDWSRDRDRAFIDDLRADFAETVLRLIAGGHNEAARDQYRQNGRGIQRLREMLRGRAAEPHIVCWQSLTAADYRPLLPALTMPVMLVYGGVSNYYGPETARYVASRIPGAALHVFDDADHSPHLADRDRFLALLRSFIVGGA
ncbi:MAG: alpha/beta fold hydrolase [Rhodospirillaceae bacterium]